MPGEETAHNVKCELPKFYGNSHDTLSAKAWCDRVQDVQKVAKWSPEQTASFACMAMMENAGLWQQNLVDQEIDERTTWDSLKKLFLERFHAAKTLAELAKLRLTIHQKANEEVADFYDRCVSAMLTLFENWKAVEAAEAAADKAAKKKAFQMFLEIDFAAGLREDIRINTLVANPKSLEELLAAAKRVEAANKEKSNKVAMVSVEPVAQQQQIEPLHEEIAAVHNAQPYQSFPNAIPYRGRGGGRGGGRGAPRGFSRGNSNGRRPLADVECHYCKRKGHYANNCYKKRSDMRENRNHNRQNQASAIDVYDYESFFQDPKNENRA